jgi:hypothetical protein
LQRPRFSSATTCSFKFRYGYSNCSLPFSPPLLSGRIFGSSHSGAMSSCFACRGPSTDYVKRVVGLPGDTVQMITGSCTSTAKPSSANALRICRDRGTRTTRIKQWRETLPNGASYAAPRPRRQWLLRQHPGLPGTHWPLFHAGRQPRQLDR